MMEIYQAIDKVSPVRESPSPGVENGAIPQQTTERGQQGHQSPVAELPSPVDDLHYFINNDEYAIVQKKSLRNSNKFSQGMSDNAQRQCAEIAALDDVPDGDFRPACGPYDRNRMLSSNRSSRGDSQWKDEF